ncbi:MAG: hypothetical protein Q8S73_20430 [Deltaproteobacteria bacterium]|nr:hypothetical protein [Myxococcales bacterium]MDP3216487.1 hypothetical protein [Deltaproteobacteria bacterium]
MIICSRPSCRLQYPTPRPRCECGASARELRRLRAEVFGGTRPGCWRYNDPGTIVVGRASRTTVGAGPDLDLGSLVAQPANVSRHVLTLVWDGGQTVRVTRVTEHGSVALGPTVLRPREGADCVLPVTIVVNGTLEITLQGESP